MAGTYGQIVNGKRITYDEFEKEVGGNLKKYILLKLTMKHVKLVKKLYRKGYTVEDTVSFVILNA